ncbi:MAG TPA: tetratricopeptide repeat protein, partial [Phenylobacterium sp.]|nr:tetratricopeptide repeat protein [Phenylobacterium sp.]
MDERLAVAEAALKAGRGAEAIEPLIGLLTDQPAQALAVYRALLFQLFSAGRHTEGEHWSALAARRFPRDMEVWNVRGVMLRKLGRHREALEALEQAVRLAPANPSPLVNMGNVLMDSKNFPKAEAVFTKLARKDPRNAEHQRQIGRALKGQGKRDAALVRFRQAVNLKKENVDCWLDLIGLLTEDGLSAEAEEAANRALAAIPGASQLLEAKCTVIRRTGQLRRAEAYLLELLPAHEEAAWLHYQLGSVICEYDRERGNLHMHRAIGLNPMKLDYLMALAESLERTRTGDEGGNIEESYQLLRRAM